MGEELVEWFLAGCCAAMLLISGVCEGFLLYGRRPVWIAAVTLIFIILQLMLIPLMALSMVAVIETCRS